ncbi:unnamed protein product [Rotaria magnacalcarata]
MLIICFNDNDSSNIAEPTNAINKVFNCPTILYPIAASSFIHHITLKLTKNASIPHNNNNANTFHPKKIFQLESNGESISDQQGNNKIDDIIV